MIRQLQGRTKVRGVELLFMSQTLFKLTKDTSSSHPDTKTMGKLIINRGYWKHRLQNSLDSKEVPRSVGTYINGKKVGISTGKRLLFSCP